LYKEGTCFFFLLSIVLGAQIVVLVDDEGGGEAVALMYNLQSLVIFRVLVSLDVNDL